MHIDQQSAINLCAACFGIVAGCWLSLGTALIHPKTIEWFANEPWDSAEGTANALISQSAQYSAGALLLVVAFGLQVWAAATPTAIPLAPYLAQLSTPFFICLSLVAAVAMGTTVFFLQRARLRKIVLPRIGVHQK
jgi:hypothetical protein